MGNTASLHKRSTALDVVEHFAASQAVPVGALLKGSFALVTGGNSGIGTETVKALAHAGCRVLMGSRTVANGEAALRNEVIPPGLGGYAVPAAAALVTVAQLELEDAASIRAFAAAARAAAGAAGIQLLVCNAGIMALPTLERTSSGWEKQLGVNHLGHFLLVEQLRDALAAPSRVVVVASEAHRMGTVDVGNLHFREDRTYGAWAAYGQSKLANVLFAKELHDQLAPRGVLCVSLHPGVIKTNLARHMGAWVTSGVGGWLFEHIVVDKSIPQGAATTLFACLAPGISGGAYLSDCAEAKPTAEGADKDGVKRKALWAKTVEEWRAAEGGRQ